MVTADCELRPLTTLLPPDFEWTPTRNEGQSQRAYEPDYPYGFLRELRVAELAEPSAVKVDFRTTTRPTAGLRATLFPQPDCQLVLGENPSIRLAQEDDARLDSYQRPFMMLRRTGQDLKSTFVTILEPYGSDPVIEATVRRQRDPTAIILQVQLEDRTDLIAISAGDTAVELPVSRGRHASYRGEIGVLSLGGGSDSVEFAYSLGKGGWRLGEFTLPSPDRQRSPLLRIDERARRYGRRCVSATVGRHRPPAYVRRMGLSIQRPFRCRPAGRTRDRGGRATPDGIRGGPASAETRSIPAAETHGRRRLRMAAPCDLDTSRRTPLRTPLPASWPKRTEGVF